MRIRAVFASRWHMLFENASAIRYEVLDSPPNAARPSPIRGFLDGTFLTQDPIGLAGGVNLYAYAGNNPTTFRDPFGLCPCILVAVEVAGTLSDLWDLGKSAVGFARGRTSGRELAATALGAGLGVVAPGSGYGRGFRGGLKAADSWGSARTLSRHFKDHGADFGVGSAEEYAELASDFLASSRKTGRVTKIGNDGVIRVYDPSTNTFGAYNPDGTTRTFFKPKRGEAYWHDQPGRVVE